MAKQIREGGCDLVRSHTMRPLQLADSAALPSFLEQFGNYTPNVRCGNHRYRLNDGLQEARNPSVIGRRSDIPATVLHEPSWPQKSDRHRHLSKHLLDNDVLRKHVRLSRLCADGGHIYDSARTRCLDR